MQKIVFEVEYQIGEPVYLKNNNEICFLVTGYYANNSGFMYELMNDMGGMGYYNPILITSEKPVLKT